MAAQPGIAVDRFARDRAFFELAPCSALTATECQTGRSPAAVSIFDWASGRPAPEYATYSTYQSSAIYFGAAQLWPGVGRAAYHFVAADARGATRSEAF
jgi:hypothetical protein